MKQKEEAKTTSQSANCRPGLRKQTSPSLGAMEQLDHVRVSEGDRELAREYLRSGELMADLIFRASGNLRSAGGLVSKFFKRAK